MIDNYAKPCLYDGERASINEFFFFDSNDPVATREAIANARRYCRAGKDVAVWRIMKEMPAGVRCVGHAPQYRLNNSAMIIGHDCANCGGYYPRAGG